MRKWPTYQKLLDACTRYVRAAEGDTTYEIALAWAQQHWNDAQRLAGAVRIFEETWNRAFYSRFGIFKTTPLEEVLERNQERLIYLRLREVETFTEEDEDITRTLWKELFKALKPTSSKPLRPVVATAKALHLLAPAFFVPFDSQIAKNYGCYNEQPRGYINFQHQMAEFASHILDSYVAQRGGDRAQAKASLCGILYPQKTGSKYTKSLAKMLDEYNWINRVQ